MRIGREAAQSLNATTRSGRASVRSEGANETIDFEKMKVR